MLVDDYSMDAPKIVLFKHFVATLLDLLKLFNYFSCGCEKCSARNAELSALNNHRKIKNTEVYMVQQYTYVHRSKRKIIVLLIIITV